MVATIKYSFFGDTMLFSHEAKSYTNLALKIFKESDSFLEYQSGFLNDNGIPMEIRYTNGVVSFINEKLDINYVYHAEHYGIVDGRFHIGKFKYKPLEFMFQGAFVEDDENTWIQYRHLIKKIA